MNKEEKKKMTYNAEQAKETAMLPKDLILEGVIVEIKDGRVSDFVTNLEKWKGSHQQTAINVSVEVEAEGKKTILEQVFTYNDVNGITEYTINSNLGKFKKKYGELPGLAQQVKIQTDGDGFGRIKLD